jgi:hypothetical protein
MLEQLRRGSFPAPASSRNDALFTKQPLCQLSYAASIESVADTFWNEASAPA